jgi:Spy/CpxP family protein refolding chaperone
MLSKTSRILIATAIVLAVFASVVVAANVAANRPAMGVTLQRFSRVLALTQDQTAEVKDILTKLHQDVKAVVQSNSTKPEKRTQVLSLREAAKNKIESVLTISQKETADSRNLVNRLLMPRRPGMMMRRALAQLNLTPDQKTRINGIVKDAAARGKTIRDRKSVV